MRHTLLSQDVSQLSACLQCVSELVLDVLLEHLFGHRVLHVELLRHRTHLSPTLVLSIAGLAGLLREVRECLARLRFRFHRVTVTYPDLRHLDVVGLVLVHRRGVNWYVGQSQHHCIIVAFVLLLILVDSLLFPFCISKFDRKSPVCRIVIGWIGDGGVGVVGEVHLVATWYCYASLRIPIDALQDEAFPVLRRLRPRI